jgi:hypothetical protein
MTGEPKLLPALQPLLLLMQEYKPHYLFEC